MTFEIMLGMLNKWRHANFEFYDPLTLSYALVLQNPFTPAVVYLCFFNT